jgi:hypothetical protein
VAGGPQQFIGRVRIASLPLSNAAAHPQGVKRVIGNNGTSIGQKAKPGGLKNGLPTKRFVRFCRARAYSCIENQSSH